MCSKDDEIKEVPQLEYSIKAVKDIRKDLDNVLQNSKDDFILLCPALNQAQLKITEAIMWFGMVLKAYGEKTPYPNGMDSTNTIIEKTADGLKL